MSRTQNLLSGTTKLLTASNSIRLKIQDDFAEAIIIYQTEDGLTKIDVNMQDETVWLTQEQMAELFQRDKSTISRHIKNIFKEYIKKGFAMDDDRLKELGGGGYFIRSDFKPIEFGGFRRVETVYFEVETMALNVDFYKNIYIGRTLFFDMFPQT